MAADESHRWPSVALSLMAIAGLIAGCNSESQSGAATSARAPVAAAAPAPAPTFCRDIAPIVFAHCSQCHHPDGAGPFSLLSYADVKNRAKQIAEVTQSRFMPPWLAEDGDCRFVGDFRLSDPQRELIRQWQQGGSPEGNAADLPAAPQWPSGWRLGEPDLVLTMPEPYKLAAGGGDVWRRFVLSTPLKSPRYVRAVDLHPSPRGAVHHAVAMIDSSDFSRRLDAKDVEVGYDAMLLSPSIHNPDGHFLSWLPGMIAYDEDPQTAWRLDPGTDLVIETHMLPKGKPADVQVSAGLYFTDEPPTKFPLEILLHSEKIDIPAGSDNFSVSDEYTLPLDAQLTAIYPHAHLLGKRIQVWATLPDGKKLTLLTIPHWDFNWQTAYRLEKPVSLPTGTKLSMNIGFDNTAANVRNPHQPPKRVLFGYRSTDEMAQVKLQLLPRTKAAAMQIRDHFLRHDAEETIDGLRFQQKLQPNDFKTELELGINLAAIGQLNDAITPLEKAVSLRPDDCEALYNLGMTYRLLNRLADCRREFEKAVQVDPDCYRALSELGSFWMNLGYDEKAQSLLERSLKIYPFDPVTHNNLAIVLFNQKKISEARAQIDEALRLNPTYEPALENKRKLDSLDPR